MPRLSPIQESFNAGQLDRRLWGRTSSDIYKRGLKRAFNWHPLVQGPIRMREGSQFLELVDSANWIVDDASTSGIRVITFQRGLDQDVVFEIGSTDLIGRNSVTGEQLTEGVIPNSMPDPQYSAAVPGAFYTFHPREQDFGDGGLEDAVNIGTFNINTPDAYHKIKNILVGSEEPLGSYVAGALKQASGQPTVIPDGSDVLINTLTIPFRVSADPLLISQNLAKMVVSIKVGTTAGGNNILDVERAVTTGWTDHVENFTPGAGNLSMYVSVYCKYDSGSPISDGGPWYSYTGVMIWSTPLDGGADIPLEFVSPWSLEQLECLQYTMDPGEKTAVFSVQGVIPQVLIETDNGWTFGPISGEAGFVAPTGSLWASEDYPQACVFHEGRLWFGGSPSFPGTLWASRSGNYYDLDAAAPDSKDDPLLFPLSSAGKIQTLTSRKQLVVNTDISEIIGDSVQGVIAFDDFSFPKQTDWGANKIQPIVVGRDMIYTSASKKKMRTFADEGNTNSGWDGNELSLLAKDIFNSAVRRMVYLDEPSYQACFLLADGTMGMATFYYPEEVIGWWKFETAFNGDGNTIQSSNSVMDITKVNTSSGAKLWMTINRVGFVGASVPAHEILGFDTGIVVALDSFETRIPDSSLQLIDLDHLSGQTCQVVVELPDPDTEELFWAVHPDVLVTAGVSEALQNWTVGGTCYIGFFYDNDFQLLSLEGVSNRGTSQVSKRRWNKVFARLNNSAVPLIEGQYPRDRTPSTPMGLGEPFIDGDVEIVDLGSGEGDIVISQDKPLISEVTGIFGKVRSSQV